MNPQSTLVWIGSMALVAVLAVGGTWLALGGSDDASSDQALAEPTADASDDQPKWLFTETATGGTFATDADGTHTLTLNGIDPEVTAFTDRPARDTAIISTEMLVRAWPTMFADSAPNAVLVEHEPSGESDSFVLTLTEPRLDGSTLTFTAVIVVGEDHSDQVPGLTATPYREPPASFSTTSLFIDDVSMGGEMICTSSQGSPDPNYWLTSPAPIPAPTTPAISAIFYKDCSAKGGYVLLL